MERRQDQLLNDFKQALRYQGLTFENTWSCPAKHRRSGAEQAGGEKRVKTSLVLAAIIKQEGIEVEDTEIDQK